VPALLSGRRAPVLGMHRERRRERGEKIPPRHLGLVLLARWRERHLDVHGRIDDLALRGRRVERDHGTINGRSSAAPRSCSATSGHAQKCVGVDGSATRSASAPRMAIERGDCSTAVAWSDMWARGRGAPVFRMRYASTSGRHATLRKSHRSGCGSANQRKNTTEITASTYVPPIVSSSPPATC
jgi:hypothetical protein